MAVLDLGWLKLRAGAEYQKSPDDWRPTELTKHPVVLCLGSTYTAYEDQFLQEDKVNEYWQLQNFLSVQYAAF